MEGTDYCPLVEPSNFDLIVVSTGFQESIIASAASAAGKAVLQLDPNNFYGHHFASLTLDGLVSFLQSDFQLPLCSSQESSDYASLPLVARSLYSELEIKSYSSQPIESSGKFNFDLCGPRVFLCSDAMIDFIIKSSVNNYMEFKSVEASFVSDVTGKLVTVPDSRSAIFKDRTLSLIEKNQLMKFFKLVHGHFQESEETKISKEDLESPFMEFLSKMGLSQKLKSFVLYAIVHANYDQESAEVCRDIVYTESAIDHLALYHSSVGRFSNANSALLYPMYGHVELPQAFCRRAAVKGSICGLGMPAVSVLMDKETNAYKGIKLFSGQEIFSSKLILPPSLSIPTEHSTCTEDAKERVARGICVAEASMRPDADNFLVFFPPRSLYPEQITAVRMLQLSSNMAVCPSGMYISYLSAVCDKAEEGKKLLNAAMDALFLTDNSRNFDSKDVANKPHLLWSALYIQELQKAYASSDFIRHTMMPDEHLDYSKLLDATEKLFRDLYPNEEFISTPDDEPTDDGSPDMDP